MIVDASPIYTDSAISVGKNKPIVFQTILFKKERNVCLYATAPVQVIKTDFPFSVTIEKPKLKPAPKQLKRSMFNLGSKVIAKSLK